jgi:PEP-CTERM motif
MRNAFGRFRCALCASAMVLQLLSSRASAVDTMADWVGRNNAPGPTYHFDSQVLNEFDTVNNVSPTSDNYVVMSPTKIGGAKQAKINYNQEPNNHLNEDPDNPTVNVQAEHSYLSDQSLDGGPFSFSNALHMDGTLQFDMPAAGAKGETGAEPNFCFCWYDPSDTRHRVGLGLSNTTETGFNAAPNALRGDLFYASSAGSGFVFAVNDGSSGVNANNGAPAQIPDGTYHFSFDYVPGSDVNSPSTAGSSMSATITDGTTTWTNSLSPLPNAPWFFDGFSLAKFGVIIRTTGGGVRNGVFNFAISDLTYTGGTAIAGVPGDYNNNGVVDAADYVLWRKGVAPLPNEVDTTGGAGVTNAGDYTAWRARFGAVSGSGSGLGAGAVPEPTTALLALLAGLVTVASWRRRS